MEYRGFEIVHWYYTEDHGWKAVVKENGVPHLQVFWAYDETDVIVLAKGYIDTVLEEEAVTRWLK